jgi:hypothetical protein
MNPRILPLIAATVIATASFTIVAQATEQSNTMAPVLILAQTQSKDNRDDRQEDRQDDRGERQDDRGDQRDDRQDCKQDEGVAGKDKRDCKQEARQDG